MFSVSQCLTRYAFIFVKTYVAGAEVFRRLTLVASVGARARVQLGNKRGLNHNRGKSHHYCVLSIMGRATHNWLSLS